MWAGKLTDAVARQDAHSVAKHDVVQELGARVRGLDVARHHRPQNVGARRVAGPPGSAGHARRHVPRDVRGAEGAGAATQVVASRQKEVGQVSAAVRRANRVDAVNQLQQQKPLKPS